MRLNRASRLALPLRGAVSLFLAGGSYLCADTPVSGTISANTTWTAALSPYVLTGSVYVEGAATPVLTIQPGVTVKFNSGAELVISYNNPGALAAIGTSGSPILFTANGSTTAGFWKGLYIGNKTPATTTQISYATVEYGGWTTYTRGGIHVWSLSPTFDHLTLRNNVVAGLSVDSGSPSLTNSTMSNNSGFAISLTASTTLGTVSGLTASGNTTDGVELRGNAGDVTVNTTWKNIGLPYIATSTVMVQKNGTPVPILTIEAGNTIKFNANGSLRSGYNYPGEIHANGTSGQPIVLTANTGSPTAGYWFGLLLYGNTTATTQITYTTISYGGGGGGIGGGVYIENASPILQNITMQNNAIAGIKVNGGSPVITNATFTSNPWGLYLSGTGSPSISSSTISSNTTGGISITSPSSPSLQTITLSSNTGYAISQDASVTMGTASGLTATGNTTNGIEVRGSTVTVNTTWKSGGLPFVVSSNVTVGAASTPILTIQAGVTVKFNAGTLLDIGWPGPGGLQAVGTSSQPITFTANSGSPTPGFWLAILMDPPTAASSQIAWATISYGGRTGYYGALHVNGCSPTLSNVTLQNNNYSGLSVVNGSPSISSLTSSNNPWGAVLSGTGSPSISSSTISSNTAGGISIYSPISPSLQTITFSGNTGYAVSQDGAVTMGTASGLTATGNTTNAIEVRGNGGTVTVNTTWKSGGLPFVVSSDVTVGAASTPILTVQAGVTVKFNANTSLWIGWGGAAAGLQAVGTSGQPIIFTANSGSPTAGFWRAVRLEPSTAASSQIAWATISYGGYTGNYGALYVNGCSPTLSSLTLQNNNHSGISVNGGSPTMVNNTFASNVAGLVNFNPAIIQNARLSYWSATNGPSGSGPGTGQSISSGVLFDPWLTASASTPEYISTATYSNGKFNPSSNPASWSLGSSQSASWTLQVSNSLSVVVRTRTASGLTAAFTWDGKNDSGVLQPDGTYTYTIQAVAGTSATPAAGRAFIDSTFLVNITAPAVSQTLSNVYQNGSTDVGVTGNVRMSGLTTWTLDYGTGSSPSSWTSINTGTQAIVASTIGTWATLSITGGVYTIRLRANDNQANMVILSQTNTVGNFIVAQQASNQMNAATGGSVTYTSTVPFTLTETLVLKNLAGQVVSTIVNAVVRNAGSFVDTWNGRNDSAALVPDGPYFYVATATAGSSSMTWDLTNTIVDGGIGVYQDQTFPNSDPFNNVPLTFTYNFPAMGRVWVRMRPSSVVGQVGDCGPPRYCAVNNQYQESGNHTLSWAWIDGTGAFRGDVTNVDIQQSTYMPKNVMVVFGTKPSVTSVQATRPFYGPANGTQTVSFNLSTYQSQTATIAVAFTNLSTNSVLRTVTVNNQAPGAVTVNWDGHADNGMWVAPGFYAVTVTATDSIGNAVSGQILTTIAY
jgi:flagellar hook assembly protein FlgD